MEITADTVITLSEGVLYSDLDDQVVVMNIESGEYFDIDPVGAFIWKRIEELQTVAAVCAALVDEYDVAPDQCEKETIEFLQELSELGAIEANEP